MGRITAHVRVTNILDPDKSISFDALVDTGAAHLVLPSAWRQRLGELTVFREVECVTATGQTVKTEVCGPVRIQIEGFEPVASEVIFLDMNGTDGRTQPLLGYIVLEQSQAGVDVVGQRLIRVPTVDLM